MKNLFIFIFIPLLISSCNANRYVLNDSNNDKYYLIDKLKEEQSKGTISSKPIVVIDGIPNRYDIELKNKSLNISKADIYKIEFLTKEIGTRLYGTAANDGVAIITTNKYTPKTESINEQKPDNEAKILFILDGKIISKAEVEAIKQEDVESIDVLKGKESIAKYTSEEYDGVIIIKMKK